VSDLDAIAAELKDARRYQLSIMLACCDFVENHAESDEWAKTLSFLLRDADTRCAVARFEASFQLPSAPR
jgi:hypothetical protein